VRSVSERVLVLVDGGVLCVFEDPAERVDTDVTKRTLQSGNVVQTVERTTRHTDADLREDLLQLYRIHINTVFSNHRGRSGEFLSTGSERMLHTFYDGSSCLSVLPTCMLCTFYLCVLWANKE